MMPTKLNDASRNSHHGIRDSDARERAMLGGWEKLTMSQENLGVEVLAVKCGRILPTYSNTVWDTSKAPSNSILSLVQHNNSTSREQR